MPKTKKRKGPSESSTNFLIGAKKKGNDGNRWIVVEIKNGVHRWQKIPTKNKKTAKKAKKTKTYFTHDNGGRPFKVVITGKNLEIFTYTQKKGKTVEEMLTDYYPSKNDYTILIKSYKNLKNIFIPKDGNTILAHISGNKYLCIAEFIYEFETKNEKILKYYSHIGNSDVPYPLAVGENNVYFLIDKGSEGYVSKDFFDGFPKKYNWGTDGYSRLWGQGSFNELKTTTSKIRKRREKKGNFKKAEKIRKKASLSKETKKIPKIKLIKKRIW
jgi:translation initiation factor IF-1